MAPASADAQAPLPIGGEFQINTYTTSHQRIPKVAAASGGDFVVVWASYVSPGTDTSPYSVQAQRYASDGSTQGVQFQVNTYTTNWQFAPAVAADTDGDFVVVWHSSGSSGTDTSGSSIQGQRYASNGSALGAQFQVNTYTTSNQAVASVASDTDGDFIVVWQSVGSSGGDTGSYSVQARRYASDGSAQGAQFQVNAYATGQQSFPFVAADADGDVVVTWSSGGSFGTDAHASSIQGQRYASNGSNQGGQFQVNTYTTNAQEYPSVAADADGNFVIVWQSYGSFGTPTGISVQGQRHASDGSTQGAQFEVNTHPTNFLDAPFTPSVAASAGGFVVVWQSQGSPGTDTSFDSVQGRRFTSDGSSQGAQFQVNTYTTDQQNVPSVTASAGDIVVVWQSEGSSATDTSYTSIQGQRYSATPAPPPVSAMSVAARFAVGALLMLGASCALRRRR